MPQHLIQCCNIDIIDDSICGTQTVMMSEFNDNPQE